MKNIQIDPPTIISLDITYKCTLRCLHCFNSSGEHDEGLKELSDDEILNLCNEIIKIKPSTVCICGGEALLRKELVYKIIRKIREGTNNHTDINMVTNGELLSLDVAKSLKECGINLVQVSLDGAKAETHEWLRGKKGAFNSAVNAIKNLRKYDIMVGVSCTPTKKNINEYKDALILCEELGVASFRVQPLMLMGRAEKNLKEYVPNYLDYMSVQKTLKNHNFDKSNKMMTEWGDPIDHLTNASMDSWNESISIGIDAYGNIQISPYIPIRVGNIRRHTLIEYWENGLSEIWGVPFVKSLCKEIKSSEDMELNNRFNNLPKNYVVKQFDVDLIDRKNFKNLTLSELLGESRGQNE